MPRWLGRLLYAFRGKRMVRVHLEVKPGTPVETIEGVLVGRWCGQHVLLQPKALEAEGRTHSLEGYVEIPDARVVFTQVLS